MSAQTMPVPSRPPLPAVPGDFRHLEAVVVVGHPAQVARTFLARHMGNPVGYRLVEARRGERIGCVRAVEIQPAEGGEPAIIEAVRVLADGTPAEDFIPDDMVERRARVCTADGRPPRPLSPHDGILLHVPVRSYLRFLPAIFRGRPIAPPSRAGGARVREASQRGWVQPAHPPAPAEAGSDAMLRFVLLFQHMMTSLVEEVEAIPSITDPMKSDARFLSWIASWVGFSLDESLPLHQQRELVRRAIRLYRTRGTRQGMEEMVRVLTSAPVRVAPRQKPAPFVLGGSTLAGGRSPADRYVSGEPPASYLYHAERSAVSFFCLRLEPRERFARRFSERAPAVLRRIVQVVTAERPAHVSFTLQFDDG